MGWRSRNDPDSDRHGIVTPYGGFVEPLIHFLAVAIRYLLDASA